MKGIIVDEELLMINSFRRLSSKIDNLDVVGEFLNPIDAISFVTDNEVDIAFLDIEMPIMNGIQLATKLKEICNDILIVFVSGHTKYIRDSNELGGDDYMLKPYSESTLRMVMDRMDYLIKGQNKDIYVQMCGGFTLFNRGVPVSLSGKAKEILALIVAKEGKEVSNAEIYNTIWPEREYSNSAMQVYYNAYRRLKDRLDDEAISELIISTIRGKMLNVSLVDCDYYDWRNEDGDKRSRLDREFLPEYSWSKMIIDSNEFFFE